MSRSPDIGGWVLLVVALGLGLLAAWVIDLRLLSENMARAAGYTVVVFALLAMALRPAWRRLRLWSDLLIPLMLHCAAVLSIMNYPEWSVTVYQGS
jgi:hypothetical protein